ARGREQLAALHQRGKGRGFGVQWWLVGIHGVLTFVYVLTKSLFDRYSPLLCSSKQGVFP
ncbi:MAG: hypothetical protein Q8Q84_16545, partial [Hydrogenophaga sp.]|nr:hypothetical protein [Hydrogenophaga sp.]